MSIVKIFGESVPLKLRESDCSVHYCSSVSISLEKTAYIAAMFVLQIC